MQFTRDFFFLKEQTPIWRQQPAQVEEVFSPPFVMFSAVAEEALLNNNSNSNNRCVSLVNKLVVSLSGAGIISGNFVHYFVLKRFWRWDKRILTSLRTKQNDTSKKRGGAGWCHICRVAL